MFGVFLVWCTFFFKVSVLSECTPETREEPVRGDGPRGTQHCLPQLILRTTQPALVLLGGPRLPNGPGESEKPGYPIGGLSSVSFSTAVHQKIPILFSMQRGNFLYASAFCEGFVGSCLIVTFYKDRLSTTSFRLPAAAMSVNKA